MRDSLGWVSHPVPSRHSPTLALSPQTVVCSRELQRPPGSPHSAAPAPHPARFSSDSASVATSVDDGRCYIRLRVSTLDSPSTSRLCAEDPTYSHWTRTVPANVESITRPGLRQLNWTHRSRLRPFCLPPTRASELGVQSNP